MKEPSHYTFEFERADIKIRISAGGVAALIMALSFAGLATTFVILKYL